MSSGSKRRRPLLIPGSLPRLADLMSSPAGDRYPAERAGDHLSKAERLPWEPLVDAPARHPDSLWRRHMERSRLLNAQRNLPAILRPDLLGQMRSDPPSASQSNADQHIHNHMSWEEWLNLQGVQLDRNPVNRLQLGPVLPSYTGGCGWLRHRAGKQHYWCSAS